MKKIIYFILIWLFFTNLPVFAETESVILDNNRFGGITKIVTYSNEKEYNKNGIQRIIYHYDNKKQKKFIEIYGTRDYSTKVGSYKTSIHYKKKVEKLRYFLQIFKLLKKDILNWYYI